MPELPFQRLDFLVDDREDPAKDRSRADSMVGDLLHGPDLHRQVKPVNNMRRWFWQRLWQALHDFRAIRENGDLSVSGISFELKGLRVLAGIVTSPLSLPSVTFSRNHR